MWNLERDGVTQGLLANFMLCPEKARLGSIEGLSQIRTGGALAFGSLVHDVLDEVYSSVMRKKNAQDWYRYTTSVLGIALAEKEAKDRKILQETKGGDIEALNALEENYGIAEGILPGYLEKWASDFEQAEWLGLEEMFDIPVTVQLKGWWKVKMEHPESECEWYEYVQANSEEEAEQRAAEKQGTSFDAGLINVRIAEPETEVVVRVRGKRDGRYRSKKSRQVWLFETKTKGRIDEDSIMDRLNFDLQTMLYLWTMWKEFGELPGGVTYNIIRKPQLRMKVKENLKQFIERIAEDVKKRPEFYYIRYQSAITEQDLLKWEKEFMSLLTQFVRWSRGEYHYKNSSACSMGGVNCQFLPVCSRGDRIHFSRKTTAFPELIGAEIEEL